MKLYIPIILLSFFLFLCQCSCNSGISGGGGSETTNSITVCIRNNQISGKASPYAHIELYCDTFNPVKQTLPESLKTIVDISGRFDFPKIENGRYNLYSYYDSADAFYRVLFIRTLIIPSDTTVNKAYEQPSSLAVLLKADTEIHYPVSLYTVNLYLKGSPFYIKKDLRSEKEFTLDQIPDGVYKCDISYSENYYSAGIVYTLPDSIEINADTATYSNQSDSLIIQVKQGKN